MAARLDIGRRRRPRTGRHSHVHRSGERVRRLSTRCGNAVQPPKQLLREAARSAPDEDASAAGTVGVLHVHHPVERQRSDSTVPGADLRDVPDTDGCELGIGEILLSKAVGSV